MIRKSQGPGSHASVVASCVVRLLGRDSFRPGASDPRTILNGGSMSEAGIINEESKHSVDETLQRLQSALEAKNIAVFALIDHSGEAKKVGMEMHPTKLLIFGNPKGGTPLMLASPSIAIDLPLKILIWEDDLGKVWVSYNSPTYQRERHHLPEELERNIAVVETLASEAAK